MHPSAATLRPMVKRWFAMVMVLLIGLLIVGALGTTALATEAEGEFREYEEIVAEAGEAGGEYLPEEYDIPGFFDWIIIPLVAVGVLVTVIVLGYYLFAQPRFARETEERSRR